MIQNNIWNGLTPPRSKSASIRICNSSFGFIAITMDRLSSLHFLHLFLTASTFYFIILSYAAEEERQVYIVYMGGIQQRDEYSVSSNHLNMLQQAMQGSFVSQSLVRSYNRSFNAFAANLTHKEHENLASFGEVVSIFPSRTLQTQTTRSWDFMGFPENVDRMLTSESDIVVGMIDTGVWPESESFNDRGFSPPPRKWKGVCRGGKNFSCNNKLVGARYYGSDSARDELGHGTHTASTAAGRKVRGTSFYGLGRGTARGGVPSARIAVYKACTLLCLEPDILAAFDDAIADGVDIISISISLGDPVDLMFDSIAIAAFHAMQKGILTVQSAGNNGPKPGGIASVAPWILTVGASTTDRMFVDRVVLGNGHVVTGAAIDTFKRKKAVKLPLVYGKDVSTNCSELNSEKCVEGCLNTTLVRNKIVVCNELADSTEAILAGAAGMIKKTPSIFSPLVVPFPESRLTHHNFASILNYINFTKHAGTSTTPKAYISATKTIHDRHAPKVAGFSARGPNSIIPNILKPDVTAPGAAILAAYSPASPPSLLIDKRSVNYSFMSGTSMACPHVSGAAAYVKSFHPNWSPSAIKSALMTTAWSLKNRKTVSGGFAAGAGHIDPAKAADPGLVYETSVDDYTKLLCSLGYNATVIRRITGNNKNSRCRKADRDGSKRSDLNYPSMAAKVERDGSFSVKFLRWVTNVGLAKSVYTAKINMKDSGVHVAVKPMILRFGALNERKSFVVRVRGKILGGKTVVGSVEWSDGIHRVGSPIVLYDDSAFHKQSR